MLTFEQARKAVEKKMEPTWDGNGTFFVSMDGREDKKGYFLTFGAEEWIIDGEPEYMMLDGGQCLVDKDTGDVQVFQYLQDPDRIDAMRPVSIG